MTDRGGHRGAAAGRFAGFSARRDAPEQETQFTILGYPATLVRDDEAAQSIEDGAHLQQHLGQRVDRFDVRLLLDSKLLRKEKRHKAAVEEEEEELEAERYRDLDPSREHELEKAGFLLWQPGGSAPRRLNWSASRGAQLLDRRLRAARPSRNTVSLRPCPPHATLPDACCLQGKNQQRDGHAG
ncbi:hypothetical protein TSOC_005737 [Tetrabaena socialis]|uniref:Suppressor of white apricot N-terminal domain-containing protein n=1 Tax=Tetrabaena socialis TaxID=47790 RepID=A0A2J8A5I1_9CHLO|nr:hypothetical protein TSOC_005737 [Tetrabaena socialis]|eukprot:PNH07765.1 hypothetical protein TSOC_005737 [Tetrabaena socialis]